MDKMTIIIGNPIRKAENMEKNYIVPSPILNKKENDLLNELTDRYEKLIKPGY